MNLIITDFKVGYHGIDFSQNRVSFVVKCSLYGSVFTNIIITKPIMVFRGIGSFKAKCKWICKILPKYYLQQTCGKQFKMVSRLKKLNK